MDKNSSLFSSAVVLTVALGTGGCALVVVPLDRAPANDAMGAERRLEARGREPPTSPNSVAAREPSETRILRHKPDCGMLAGPSALVTITKTAGSRTMGG